jgi:hypothetical protein
MASARLRQTPLAFLCFGKLNYGTRCGYRGSTEDSHGSGCSATTASHGEVVVRLTGAKRGTFPSIRVMGRPKKVVPVTNLHDRVRSAVADMMKLWRALGSRELRGRVGPRLIYLHGYTHGVTADIIGPSSHREAAGSGGNIDGMTAAWEHSDDRLRRGGYSLDWI